MSPRILVGPLLRYVDETRATIWVETDRPAVVEVLGVREPTWTVHGHHYALVVIDGLSPGSETPYEVHLDGTRVWPEPDSPFPPSVVRAFRHDETFRLAFGSCRRVAPFDRAGLRKYGADALVALAYQMRTAPHDTWPDALFLAGDQVYADMPSARLHRRLKALHDGIDDGLGTEIRDFEEYTWLYHESWNTPAVRWLLSTVPSCMLLDDHDLRDDWNTSAKWREHVTAQPWWRDRVVGGFASYWVYQHLGNLSPDQLAEDVTYQKLRQIDDDDERTRLLDEFAWRADTEPESTRWSFYRDFGNDVLGIRMVAVDCRCARKLNGHRVMVDEPEWRWLVDHAMTPTAGQRIDHLLIGTTLPYLLPPGVHHVEAWNEAVAEGAWGHRPGRAAEHVRQLVDLEHWAAFQDSFDQMHTLLQEVAERDDPPASTLLLSGDVHCSYLAEASLPGVDQRRTVVHQLTMSPFRNPLELPVKLAHRLAGTRLMRRLGRRLARAANVPDFGMRWELQQGPWFDNGVMTVMLDGRDAWVEIEHADVVRGRQLLRHTGTYRLTHAA
ncbi:MAG: alkaline phosphatase family protein [Streptosporangiales bacterium]|nr:alkaline phosphatase family protein [Streptosporangiales bacterium]